MADQQMTTGDMLLPLAARSLVGSSYQQRPYQVVYWFATFDHDGWLMTSLQVACLLWLVWGRHLRDGCLLGTVPQISRVAPCKWVFRSDRFRACCRLDWTVGNDHTTERTFNDSN